MRGGGGSDEIFGEAGNDLIIGDADGVADLYDGGEGIDNVSYVTTVAGINANLGLNFAFGAEIGVDRLENIENLTGGRGDDSLIGAASTQRLDGGAGNDVIDGGTGNNTLLGGDGNDTIRGFAGFDRIEGGAGNDRLTGDFNADTFVFANGFGKDTITDFDEFNNSEKIDLAGVTEIIDFADLAANHLTQVGANAVITDGVDTITILNANIADLDANDFIF
ncbi:calcium-binding protein, partial [Aurantimonas sp. 22II-16-19i]|uniref:calcium-binding protein n=1 Tax=Aurantimonas sp. 22II-16-19i TaxID=1317114 RepID=UPI0009F7EA5F